MQKMNFYESKLFRCRPFQRALAETLLTALDRMTEEELREYQERQHGFFRQRPLLNLNEKLRNDLDAIVPAGFLVGTSAPSTGVGATIETLIEIAAGSTAQKLSIPLQRLLGAISPSFSKSRRSPPRSPIQHGILAVVFIHLAVQNLVLRILNTFSSAGEMQPAASELVFCIVAKDTYPEPAIASQGKEDPCGTQGYQTSTRPGTYAADEHAPLPFCGGIPHKADLYVESKPSRLNPVL